MSIKLSSLNAPALAGVVREKTAAAAIAEIQNCTYSGADMIDLHVSCLADRSIAALRSIVNASRLPILALNYNIMCDPMDEDARVESMLNTIEAGAAGLDMQGYTYDTPSKTGFHGDDNYSFTKNSPLEVVTDSAVIGKQCALIERVHSMDAEVLLSCHPGIPMKAEQVVELALFLEERKPDIIKIVTTTACPDDLTESFRAMQMLKREVKTPVAYHAGGKFGQMSRIVNPLLGGQIAFCVDRYKESSTLEQPELRTVRTIIDNMKRML